MPLKLIRDNIINVHADIIVNTANPEPIIGSGVDAAIYNAAGKENLLNERKNIGKISPSEIAITQAFNLKVKHIIHTVSPFWQGGN